MLPSSPAAGALTYGARAFVAWSCFAAFCLLGLFYYAEFTLDFERYLFSERFLSLALNSHDHLVYVDTMDIIERFGVEYSLNNHFGIAWIYHVLGALFPALVNPEMTLLSFLVNLITMVCCFHLWSSICEDLRLGLTARLAFFLNASLLYYLQLINKDMFTIFFFLLSVRLGMQGKLLQLLLWVPVMLLVRQQLAGFALVLIFIARGQRPLLRILIAYVITSLVAGFLSVHGNFIGEETFGEGFSGFLVNFNQKYYVGYLLFNPLRVLQYIVDAYSSFFLFGEDGNIDMARLLRLPILLALLYLGRPLASMVLRFRYWLDTPLRPMALVVVAYLLAWLINPTVNARYVILITPVLLLFAMAAKAHRFEEKCVPAP